MRDAVETLPPLTLSTRDGEEGGTAASSARPGGAFWWVLAGIALIATVAVRVHIAQTAVAPRTPWDENGLLEMARIIAGQSDVPPMSGAGYYPGFSFLIAPVWWFTQDAATVYTASLWISTAIGVATIWPLTLLARRFGLGLPQALVAAAIVMTLPAQTVNADYVLSEQTLGFFVVWAAVGAFALWDRPTWWRLAGFVGAVLAAFLVHARALLLVLVAGVWLVAFLRRRWQVAAAGLAALVVGYLAVRALALAIAGQILLGGFSQADNVLKSIKSTTPSFLLHVMLTQTWAQLVGSVGLVAVGAIVVALWTFADLRRFRTLGPSAFVLGTALAATLLSFAAWAGPASHMRGTTQRFDSWVYTRYIDPFMMVVILVAVTVLFRRLSRSVLWVSLAAAGAVISATVFWAIQWVPSWGTMDGPVNPAGILPFSTFLPRGGFDTTIFPTWSNEHAFWVIASLVVLGSLLVMILLRSWPAALAALLIAGTVTLSLHADPSQPRDWPRGLQEGLDAAESVAGEELSVDFATRCATTNGFQEGQTLNWIGFWFSPRDVDAVYPDGDFDSEIVVACMDWELADALGARSIDGADDYGYTVWVLPGDVQDGLAAEGALRD